MNSVHFRGESLMNFFGSTYKQQHWLPSSLRIFEMSHFSRRDKHSEWRNEWNRDNFKKHLVRRCGTEWTTIISPSIHLMHTRECERPYVPPTQLHRLRHASTMNHFSMNVVRFLTVYDNWILFALVLLFLYKFFSVCLRLEFLSKQSLQWFVQNERHINV